ncbi:MAG: anti-sigma factor [Candidatus Eremiobacteraeota bacterium]|nr:anti-sigma factor [Candidatus Eremiobacteraeota bacterium]
MNAHDEFLDQVAVYALGSLSKSEAGTVRNHLKTCVECRAEYDALRPVVNAVAQSAEAGNDAVNGAIVPSQLLKARLMKTVRAEAAVGVSEKRPRAIVWPAYIVAAASIVLALWATGSNILVKSEMRQEQEQVAALSAQVKSANGTVANQKLMVADLMNHDSQRYQVANGEVVRHGDRIYIAMHAMNMPPKGHVYQAWMLHNGAKEMTPSVTFMPDHGGLAVVSLPGHASIVQAVAVSIEPEGGSKAPTTKPEFVVKFT